jgi:DNA-binding cell septation regulator SpoVG
MKISRMNPYNGESKTAAFFDVETQEGIIVKGFKLIKGQNGLFSSPPSEKGKDDKYYERVLLSEDQKKELNDLAVKAYEEIEI